MGIDASILFTVDVLETHQAFEIVKAATVDASAQNVIILLSNETVGPACVKARLPRFTTISLWADGEVKLRDVARFISGALQKKLVGITAADHAGAGGWEMYDGGGMVESFWSSSSSSQLLEYASVPSPVR